MDYCIWPLFLIKSIHKVSQINDQRVSFIKIDDYSKNLKYEFTKGGKCILT